MNASLSLLRSPKWPAFTGFLEILFLTAGILAGSFTLNRFFDFPDFIPSVFLDIRTLGLIAFAVVWGYRRYMGWEEGRIRKTERWSLVSLLALGALFIYMLIGNATIWEKPAAPSAFYPLAFTILYSIAALLCIDRIEKLYLMAKIGISLIAAVILTVFVIGDFSKDSLTMMPMVSPFFFSRSALVCFAFSLLLFREEWLHNRSWPKAAFYATCAILFIYVGLLTYQRSTLVFYSVVGFGVLMVLAARREYTVAGAMLATVIAGYALAFSFIGNSLISRIAYHSPTHITMKIERESGQPNKLHFGNEDKAGDNIVNCPKSVSLRDNILCGLDPKKVAECRTFLQTTPRLDNSAKIYVTDESCRSAVVFNDSDARYRLMQMAVTDTPSKMFGKGLDSFYFVQFDARQGKTYVYFYPHSIFFGVYHDTGLIGLALLMLSVCAMVILGLRIIIQAPSSAIILLIIPFYYLICSLVSGDIYDARFLWLIPVMIRNCILSKNLQSAPREAA